MKPGTIITEYFEPGTSKYMHKYVAQRYKWGSVFIQGIYMVKNYYFAVSMLVSRYSSQCIGIIELSQSYLSIYKTWAWAIYVAYFYGIFENKEKKSYKISPVQQGSDIAGSGSCGSGLYPAHKHWFPARSSGQIYRVKHRVLYSPMMEKQVKFCKFQ